MVQRPWRSGVPHGVRSVADGYLIDGRISDLPTPHGASMPAALRELLEEAVARGERRVAARGATYDLDVF